ncbi:MAG: 2-amino-4-hydroxy-6-hydroxymethyldihydropteridine diphosphokinase [Chitinophagaceae bacterium]
MNKAYLLLGGNLGNRLQNLQAAKQLIERTCGEISRTSSVYETAAWGRTDQTDFYNQAIELKTELNAKQLMRRVLKIEKQLGRQRKEKFAPRLIDIDILFFNDEVCDYPFLKLPHPAVHLRRFALIPLAEITNLTHPVLKKTISELLQACADNLQVKEIAE